MIKAYQNFFVFDTIRKIVVYDNIGRYSNESLNIRKNRC